MGEELGDSDDSIFESIIDEDEGSVVGSFVEDSFLSFIAEHGKTTSTPVKISRPSTSRQPVSTTKVRLPCDVCGNTYANERTLAVHRKMHAMKGATARIPDKDALITAGRHFLQEVLEEIYTEEKETGCFPEVAGTCEQLLERLNDEAVTFLLEFFAELFLKTVKSQNALLPSALRTALYVNSNKLMGSADFKQRGYNLLLQFCVLSTETSNLFFGVLLFKLSEKFLAFVLRQMRGAEGALAGDLFKRGSDKLVSVDFQQTVHYISGFVIYSNIGRGEKNPSSSWSVYVDTLKRNFIAKPGSQGNVSVQLFTEKKNRGGLKFCSSEAFDFFKILFDFLMSLENSEGGLLFDVIDTKVSSNEGLLLWDDLVGADLNEVESLEFLLPIVHSCAEVVSKGILKRRLNEELRKSYSNVALRAKLAS